MNVRVLFKELKDLKGSIVLFGGPVSDSYGMDSALKDSKFGYTLYAVVTVPPADRNTIPIFASALEKLEIFAEIAFKYTLP